MEGSPQMCNLYQSTSTSSQTIDLGDLPIKRVATAPVFLRVEVDGPFNVGQMSGKAAPST